MKKEESGSEDSGGEDSGRPWKKSRKEAPTKARKEAPTMASKEAPTAVGGMTKEKIEQCFKDLSDAMRDGFGMCPREIKFFGERMESVEKKVGITKKGLYLMIINSLLQIRLNVAMNSRLVPKTLPKSQSRESLDKVLGIENETWMCFVSCVCLDVPFVCQHICALFLVCASNFAYV